MLVVATGLTQAPNDKQQVAPMLQTLQAQAPRLGSATALIADTGYCSEKNIAVCEQAGITPFIAVAREDHHPHWSERHSEPPALAEGATPMQAMAHKLKTLVGAASYALRKQTVEPVFGIIKSVVMGLRQFSLRGLKKVKGEWSLVCLAREMGLVKLGTIAVDGTKIKANASRNKAMSYARMQSTEADLKAQIAALLQKAAHTDEAEKNEPDLDIPVELKRRQARLAAIEAAKARLEERQSQNDMARGRSAGDGRKPRDKDGKPKDAVQTHTGAQPAQVLADAGYRSEAVMARLAQAYPDTELVIALGREGKARTAPKDAKRYPHTVAMAAKFQTEQGQKDYRKRK